MLPPSYSFLPEPSREGFQAFDVLKKLRLSNWFMVLRSRCLIRSSYQFLQVYFIRFICRHYRVPNTTPLSQNNPQGSPVIAKLISQLIWLGLAIGLCVCFFALLYLNFELSYDTYHEKADRIYRLVTNAETATGIHHQSTTAFDRASNENVFSRSTSCYKNFPGLSDHTKGYLHLENKILHMQTRRSFQCLQCR